MIVICPNCGARNRIPDEADVSKTYHCGKCKASISITESSSIDISEKSSVTSSRRKKKRQPILKTLRESWLKPPILHPLFIGIFPILALYSQNKAELSVSETYSTLAITVGITIAMLVFFWYIFKNAVKVGIALSVFMILFFSYGHIVGRMEEANIGIANQLMTVLWVIIYIIAIYLIVRTKKELRKFTIVLNIITFCLVLVSSVTILMYEINRTEPIQAQGSPVVGNGTVTGNLPDIYYITVDGYGSNEVLNNYLSFDNSEFTSYLLDRGFYVASESKSNYPITLHSLASSLNMEYLNYMADEPIEEVTDRHPFQQMIQNNKMSQFLKAIGYEYIYIGAHWSFLGPSDYADICYPAFPSSEFDRMLVNTTWLRATPQFAEFVLGSPSNGRLTQYECALNQFENLATVIGGENSEQPMFVYCHVVIPHSPFVFEPDGTFMSVRTEFERSTRDNYINQLMYCNTRVKELVDNILQESEHSPIIVLQSDHGPMWEFSYVLNSLPIEDQNEARFGILNAYHLPEEGSELLYSSISPVNSFRLIFNTYLGGDFEILPDESYMSGPPNYYEFELVTDFPAD